MGVPSNRIRHIISGRILVQLVIIITREILSVPVPEQIHFNMVTAGIIVRINGEAQTITSITKIVATVISTPRNNSTVQEKGNEDQRMPDTTVITSINLIHRRG